MDVLASLPAFMLAVLLMSASPGPAMALIFRRAALRGLRGAVPTVLGLEAGLYVWALFAGAGFATLVAPGVRHHGAARAAADHAGDRPLPGARRRCGPRRGLVRPPRIRARLDAVSGTVLVALGLRVATTAR